MEYLKFTPELANNWKNALSMGSKTHLLKRVLDSMNQSQLESKLWIIQELLKLEIEPKRVAILAGWYAQYIVPLLYDNFESLQFAENFEIDQDVKRISYTFNKRLKDDKKHVITIKNVMFDRIVNRSCYFFSYYTSHRTTNKSEIHTSDYQIFS